MIKQIKEVILLFNTKESKMTEAEFDDPEQKEFELKMCKMIEDMPIEVKDRFKALKVYMD